VNKKGSHWLPFLLVLNACAMTLLTIKHRTDGLFTSAVRMAKTTASSDGLPAAAVFGTVAALKRKPQDSAMNKPEIDFTLDATGLYREDIFTDGKVGTLRRMTPVTADGSDDSSRPLVFQGQAQVYTPNGALPIHFELDVATLEEAVAGFGAAAQQGLEDTLKELQEMRRQAASQIVVPGAGGAPGVAPGGKIQLR
jgi:hypothetical protein